MSQVGNNIKKLRKVKGLSQQAFAELFGLSRGNISSYEEQRAEPKTEMLIEIANYFSIPLEDLLHKNLSVNEILNFEDYFHANENESRTDWEKVPFLSREQQDKLSSVFEDMDVLPKLTFPLHNPHTFLAVELNDNVPYPIDFKHKELSIAFFQQVEIEVMHTLNEGFGLFFSNNQFFIGKYCIEDKKIFLILNDWKKEELTTKKQTLFWKLYGIFERV